MTTELLAVHRGGPRRVRDSAPSPMQAGFKTAVHEPGPSFNVRKNNGCARTTWSEDNRANSIIVLIRGLCIACIMHSDVPLRSALLTVQATCSVDRM